MNIIEHAPNLLTRIVEFAWEQDPFGDRFSAHDFDCARAAVRHLPETTLTSAEHIERLRRKAKEADGLGPFWRDILLNALDQIDAQRNLTDAYGVALMMIREGCADPAAFAGEIVAKRTADGKETR